MNRQITTHIVPGEKDHLLIGTMDKPGHGGAHHEYEIFVPDSSVRLDTECVIFQNGPIKEFGVNGITHEVLLAIIIDRLTCFQNGPFPSDLNAKALHHCQEALTNLQERTKDRIARNVEGKSVE